MKQLIQNLGLIIFLIAVVLLVIGLMQEMENNHLLIVSGIMIVAGLFAHVILNKKLL